MQYKFSLPFPQWVQNAATSNWLVGCLHLLGLSLAWKLSALSGFAATGIAFSLLIDRILTGKSSLLSDTTVQILILTEGLAPAMACLVLRCILGAVDDAFNKGVAPKPALLVLTFAENLLLLVVEAGVVVAISRLVVFLVGYGFGPEAAHALINLGSQ